MNVDLAVADILSCISYLCHQGFDLGTCKLSTRTIRGTSTKGNHARRSWNTLTIRQMLHGWALASYKSTYRYKRNVHHQSQ